MRRRIHTASSNKSASNFQSSKNMNEKELQQKMYQIIDSQMNEFKKYMTQKLLTNFSKQKMVNYIEDFEKDKQKKKLVKKKNQKTHRKKMCSQSFVSSKSMNRNNNQKKKINFNDSVLLPSFEFQRKKTKKKLGVRSMVNSPSQKRLLNNFQKAIKFNVNQNKFSFRKKQAKKLKQKKIKVKQIDIKKQIKTPKAPKKKHKCQCKNLLQNPVELQSQRQMEKYLNGNFNQILMQDNCEYQNDFQPQNQSCNNSIIKNSETDSYENVFQKSYEQIDVQSQSQQEKSDSEFHQGLQIGDFDNIEKSNEDNYEIILRESIESSRRNSNEQAYKNTDNKRVTFGKNDMQNLQIFSQALHGRELSMTNLQNVVEEDKESIQSKRNDYEDDNEVFLLEEQRQSLKEGINNLKNSFGQ